MVWTTCAAVAIFPSAEISTPAPISLNFVTPSSVTSSPPARITTTEGFTRRYTSPSVSDAAGTGATRSSVATTHHAPQPGSVAIQSGQLCKR